MEVVEQLLYLRLAICYLCQYVAVYIFERTERRYFAIEIFTRQYQRPIDEIAILILPQYGKLDGFTICFDCWKVHDVLVFIIE